MDYDESVFDKPADQLSFDDLDTFQIPLYTSTSLQSSLYAPSFRLSDASVRPEAFPPDRPPGLFPHDATSSPVTDSYTIEESRGWPGTAVPRPAPYGTSVTPEREDVLLALALDAWAQEVPNEDGCFIETEDAFQDSIFRAPTPNGILALDAWAQEIPNEDERNAEDASPQSLPVCIPIQQKKEPAGRTCETPTHTSSIKRGPETPVQPPGPLDTPSPCRPGTDGPDASERVIRPFKPLGICVPIPSKGRPPEKDIPQTNLKVTECYRIPKLKRPFEARHQKILYSSPLKNLCESEPIKWHSYRKTEKHVHWKNTNKAGPFIHRKTPVASGDGLERDRKKSDSGAMEMKKKKNRKKSESPIIKKNDERNRKKSQSVIIKKKNEKNRKKNESVAMEKEKKTSQRQVVQRDIPHPFPTPYIAHPKPKKKVSKKMLKADENAKGIRTAELKMIQPVSKKIKLMSIDNLLENSLKKSPTQCNAYNKNIFIEPLLYMSPEELELLKEFEELEKGGLKEVARLKAKEIEKQRNREYEALNRKEIEKLKKMQEEMDKLRIPKNNKCWVKNEWRMCKREGIKAVHCEKTFKYVACKKENGPMRFQRIRSFSPE